MIIQFMQYSQQKNRRISYFDLKQLIQDWNIEYRVEEKIVICGIGYSIKKMKALPTEFIFEAFVFYMLKYHSSLITDYTENMLDDCQLSLKKVYNSCSIDYFKSNQNYNFTMVILAKVLKYFLVSVFPQQKLQLNVQAHIFITVTYVIIGYPVDYGTYDLIEQKIKMKYKKKHVRHSKSLDEIMIENQMRRTVDKKIRRCGLNGTLAYSNQNKQLQHFRVEIQQCLRTKILPSKKILSEKGKHNEIKCLRVDDQSFMKVSKSPQISFYQISSAMKINDGFECAKKSPKMHLSKKKIGKKQGVNEDVLTVLKNSKTMVQLHKRKSLLVETQNNRSPNECSSKYQINDKQPMEYCQSLLLTVENRLSEDLPLKTVRKVDFNTSNIKKSNLKREIKQRCFPKINRK